MVTNCVPDVRFYFFIYFFFPAGVSSWDHSEADGWCQSHTHTPAAGAQPPAQDTQRLYSRLEV